MPKATMKGIWLSKPTELDMTYPLKVEVLVDKFIRSYVPGDEVRIILVWEPTLALVSDVMMYPDFYNHVLTYHDFILKNNAKASYFMGVTTFARHTIVHEKRFSVSTVVGDKRGIIFPGYNMRHELWFKRGKITIPKEFYLSGKTRYKERYIRTIYGDIDTEGQLTLGEYKDEVFDSMFHIGIENSFLNGWFTEKIMDCFLTRTVPIYIGDEKIGDFFNLDGIIRASNVEEVISIVNKLTPDDYFLRLPAMEDNYQRSMKYLDFNKMLSDKLREILK